MVVGGFSAAGLSVSSGDYGDDYYNSGVGPLWKF